MQVNGTGTGLQSEINVTPLVDVVLVLLIIFMVVVPLLLKGYDVDIPRQSAAATAPAQAEQAQVILSITPATCRILEKQAGEGLPEDCHVILAGRQIPAADLPARVAEVLGGRAPEQRVLFLAVDDHLNYEGVLRIVDLAKSGVDDLQIEFITAH